MELDAGEGVGEMVVGLFDGDDGIGGIGEVASGGAKGTAEWEEFWARIELGKFPEERVFESGAECLDGNGMRVRLTDGSEEAAGVLLHAEAEGGEHEIVTGEGEDVARAEERARAKEEGGGEKGETDGGEDDGDKGFGELDERDGGRRGEEAEDGEVKTGVPGLPFEGDAEEEEAGVGDQE